ncbi:MAG: response receiver sensor diguanylate cyclase [Candidatus Saccharibacteria bacterium]|jgi:PAS domain S-box-containing protein|nr:response receiver sensor diguanylate cyclase [Candidatus Saccharibacteria bacterium]
MAKPLAQNNSFAIDTREDLVINAIEIFDTIKQSLVVLNKDLVVVMANASFYTTFRVTREQTEGSRIYDIGNGQWNIDKLRVLLEKIIPDNKSVNDYEVTHNFESIGEKVMLLNAREIIRQDNRQEVILVAIEDITLSKQLERETIEAESKISSVLEGLVKSSMRFSGGTAPQKSERKNEH